MAGLFLLIAAMAPAQGVSTRNKVAVLPINYIGEVSERREEDMQFYLQDITTNFMQQQLMTNFKKHSMKGKYITTQILLACKSKSIKTDIHAQLEETLAERKRLMEKLEQIAKSARVIDMYLETEAA